MTDGDPKTAVDHEPAPRRRRVRVKKRVTPVFHLSRKRQQLVTALVIAVAVAIVVAWFAGASLDNPGDYIPGGAVH